MSASQVSSTATSPRPRQAGVPPLTAIHPLSSNGGFRTCRLQLRCIPNEWPFFTPHRGAENDTVAAIFVLRAHAARFGHFSYGLLHDLLCETDESPLTLEAVEAQAGGCTGGGTPPCRGRACPPAADGAGPTSAHLARSAVSFHSWYETLSLVPGVHGMVLVQRLRAWMFVATPSSQQSAQTKLGVLVRLAYFVEKLFLDRLVSR